MSFLTPLLLAGMLLIGIPIVLHMAMRREPQRLEFPALRLLKRRRKVNESRLRLRRWLLLALRCAVIALLALALARPVLLPPGSAEAAKRGAVGEGMAVAMVFDNGINMQYQRRNKTRLEGALETADWLLKRLPKETDVVITDRRKWNGTMQDKPLGALSRIDRIDLTEATRPLESAVSEALARLDDLPAAHRELYLFTDLSAGVWNEAMLSTLAGELERRPEVSLQLIDVGVDEPNNLSIESVRPENEILSVGQTLRLRASVHLVGNQSTPRNIQLWLQEQDEQGQIRLVKRDERPVVLRKGASDTEVLFSVNGLDEGFHGGVVQLTGGDPLVGDDRSYFCVEVRPPPALLLVGRKPEESLFFREAVAPSVLEPGLVAPYDCQEATFGELVQLRLNSYAGVLLFDPPALGDLTWNALASYASSGGSVGVALGRRASLDECNSTAAQKLLPATLRWRNRNATYLRPIEYSHPLLSLLADYAEAVPWPAYPVFQRWELEKIQQNVGVVASYADGAPAVLEHSVGAGRVVLVTTSFSDRLNQPEPWNLLPTGEDPWPFMLLANGMAEYLCGLQEGRLNYAAGETVVAPLPRSLDSTGYVLRTPSGDAVRQTRLPGQSEATIGSADKVGIYQLEAGGTANRWRRAFAMNHDVGVAQLDRVPFEQIASVLGSDRVRLVHDRDTLSRSIALVRVGRELFPWIICLVVIAFVAEQVISNHFYTNRSDSSLDAVDV